MLKSYGASWDEPLHRDWGQLFAQYWQTGDYEFLTRMAGSGMFYGPLYFALNVGVTDWLVDSLHLPLYEAAHVLNVALFALSAGVLFAVARSWFGRRIAALAALLFVLFPLLVAHAQYNPKDIPLLLLVMPAMFFGQRAIDHPVLRDNGAIDAPSWRNAALAGLFLGLGFGVKVSAVVFGVVLGTAWAARAALRVPLVGLRSVALAARRELLLLPAVFGSALGAAVIAWPSLIRHPGLLVGGIKLFLTPFWPGHVLYLGENSLGAELPWHYIPMQFVLAVPLATLLCTVVGVSLTVRRTRRAANVTTMLVLLTWLLLPLMLSMKPGLVRYDGMRNFFFVVPALTMLAAIGLDWIVERLVAFRPAQARAIRATVPVVVALWLLREIAMVHPYEGSYVSEIGRAALGPEIGKSIELEFWGPSMREGMEWLVQNADANPTICVPTAPVLLRWYPQRPDLKFGCSPQTNYLMFFTRYSELPPGLLESLPAPTFTVARYGSDLLRVYKVQ